MEPRKFIKIGYAEDNKAYAFAVFRNIAGTPDPRFKKAPQKKLKFNSKGGSSQDKKFVNAEVKITHHINVEHFMLEIQKGIFDYDMLMLDNNLPGGIDGKKFAKLLKASKDELMAEKQAYENGLQTNFLIANENLDYNDFAIIRKFDVDYSKVLTQLIENPQNHLYITMISSDDLKNEGLSKRGIDHTTNKEAIGLAEHCSTSTNCPFAVMEEKVTKKKRKTVKPTSKSMLNIGDEDENKESETPPSSPVMSSSSSSSSPTKKRKSSPNSVQRALSDPTTNKDTTTEIFGRLGRLAINIAPNTNTNTDPPTPKLFETPSDSDFQVLPETTKTSNPPSSTTSNTSPQTSSPTSDEITEMTVTSPTKTLSPTSSINQTSS